MRKDSRIFTPLDVAYFQNPKWFKVERWLHENMPTAMPTAMQTAVLVALREAREAHLQAICYCVQSRTDGMFPVAAIKGLARIENEEAITALFEVGLWINLPGGMAEVHDFLAHNQSAAELEEASRLGREKADRRWSKNADSNADGNANGKADSNAEKRREEKRREEGDNQPSKRSRATTYPASWAPKESHRVKAQELGLDVAWEASQFQDTALAKGTTYLDWDRAFFTWLRKSVEFGNGKQAGKPKKINDDPYPYLKVIN